MCSKKMERVGNKIFIKDVFIYYEKVGRGRHVLLLLPGNLGTCKTDFDFQLENLDRDQFTIIAWEPPGFGRSRPPERNFSLYSLHQDADYAAALMEKLGYGKYSILGYSNGGRSGLVLAARYSERIDKMVLWGVSCLVTQEEIDFAKRLADVSIFPKSFIAPYIKVYGEELFKKMWKETYKAFFDSVESGHCDLLLQETDKIYAQTLIIHGAFDLVIPKASAEYLHHCIKCSRFVSWNDAPHNLHQRFPERFKKLVEDFLLKPMSRL